MRGHDRIVCPLGLTEASAVCAAGPVVQPGLGFTQHYLFSRRRTVQPAVEARNSDYSYFDFLYISIKS